MSDQLRGFLNQFIKLNDEAFQNINNSITIKSLKKNELLFKAGEICNKIAFYEYGYFRFYHFTSEGKEVTTDFYFAPNFITSYTSLITGKPAQVYVQAMENMEVFEIRKSDLENLYTKHHSIERLGRLLAEQVVINSEKHLFSVLNQSAEERYQNLLNEFPTFVQEIPLQYIASYLGVTQETLSRVRKRVR